MTAKDRIAVRKEEMLAVAKRKEMLCPLPLRWFKVVKYVSLVGAFLSAFGFLLSAVDVWSLFRNEELADKLSENFRNVFSIYFTLSVVIIVIDAVVCVWRYKVLTYLPKSGFRQLVAGFVISYSLGIISSVSKAMINDNQALELYGTEQNTLLAALIPSIISAVFFFILNFIYFRKRKAIFDESMEYGDENCEYKEVTEICPRCGASLPDGQMFCSKCGKNIDYEN
ncbi:MAG: zinc ribbon domain-containing protein [Ruminiclostridium sp.]|nr:zinc ribbon domain-containing protein [Ruminiclostridium sp.]